MRRTHFLLTIFVVTATLMAVGIVHAHAGYVRSEPAADSAVPTAPATVRIWFTQELFRRAGENGIEVYGPEGNRVDTEDATIDDDDRTLLSVGLQPDLRSGVYRVQWYTLSSEDGHEGQGEFIFTVGDEAIPEPTSLISPTLDVELTSTPVADAATDIVEEDETPESEPTLPTVEATSAPTGGMPSSLPCMGTSLLFALVIGGAWFRRQSRFIHDESL